MLIIKSANPVRLLPIAVIICSGFGSVACNNNTSDADIQQKINNEFKHDQAGAALNATVNNGVATITGECAGDSCVEHIKEKIQNIKGVKDVQTHIIVKK